MSSVNLIQLECNDRKGMKKVWTMLDESIHALRRNDGSFSLFLMYRSTEVMDSRAALFPSLGLIPFRNRRNSPDPINLLRHHEESELYSLIQPLNYPLIVGTNTSIGDERINIGDTVEIHFETIPYLIYRMRIRDKIASQWISCGLQEEIDFYLCFAHPKKVLKFLGDKEKALYEISQHRLGILDENTCCICNENLVDHAFKCGHMVCYKCFPGLKGICWSCRKHSRCFRVRFLTSVCAIDSCYLNNGDKPFCANPCGCVYGKCLPSGRINDTLWEYNEQNEEQNENQWKVKPDSKSGQTPSCLRCKQPVTDFIKLFWELQ